MERAKFERSTEVLPASAELPSFYEQHDHKPRIKPDSVQLFPRQRIHQLALCFLLLLALALRLAWACSGPEQRFDEYAEIATHVAAGQGFSWSVGGTIIPTDIRAPLYPLLISACLAATKSLHSVVILQVAISTATCYLAFVLGATLFGVFEGLLCALLSASDIYQIIMVRYLLTETLYVFLILLSGILLLLVLRSQLNRLSYSVLTAYSIAISLAILVRQEAEVYLAASILYAFCSHRPWMRSNVVRMAFVVGLVLSMLLPWAMRNYIVVGDFALSNSILVDYNLYRGLEDVRGNPSGDYGFQFYNDIRSGKLSTTSGPVRGQVRKNILREWLAISKEHPKTVLTERIVNLSRVMIYRGEFFFTQPLSLPELVHRKLWLYVIGKALIDSVLGVLPWCLALVGTYVARKRGQLGESLTLWIFPFCILMLMIPLWGDSRYMLPAHVLLAPLVALGVFKIGKEITYRMEGGWRSVI